MKNRLDISDQTAISMPMRNLISIVAAVAVGVWAYFGVLERITMLETKSTLAEKDLQQAQERICLLYTSPSPRDLSTSRMPSSA